jgi:hypothetical protein
LIEEGYLMFCIQIVELINQASLYGKDSVRVQHLRHVQELILRKDPSLLDNFLEVYFIINQTIILSLIESL